MYDPCESILWRPWMNIVPLLLAPVMLSDALRAVRESEGRSVPFRLADPQTPFGLYQRLITSWKGYSDRWAVPPRPRCAFGAHDSLAAMLARYGFEAPPLQLADDEIGVATVTGFVAEWPTPPLNMRLSVINATDGKFYDYNGMVFPRTAREIYEVEGALICKIPLLRQRSLWLTMREIHARTQPLTHPMELFECVLRYMHNMRGTEQDHRTGLMLPMLDTQQTVSLDWLRGLRCGTQNFGGGIQGIHLALGQPGTPQEFPGWSEGGEPMIFDKPFIGWITNDGDHLPELMFQCGRDWWQPVG